MNEDREIWEQICAGEVAAFSALYRSLAPRLCAFIRQVTGDMEAAEDIVQETFVGFWKQPAGYNPEYGTLRSWLFGVGKKRAAEWWRHLRRGALKELWQKGWKTMRIPRLAFTSLLVAVLALGSGLALTAVRARTSGSVLLLQYSTGDGPQSFCSLSAVDPHRDSCGGVRGVKSGILLWQLKVLSKSGDQATLGIRSSFQPSRPDTRDSVSFSQIEALPQRQYVFTPGDTLDVNVDGFGTLLLTGQWIDHIPAIASGQVGADQSLDPAPDELRFFQPILMSNHKVLGDLTGATASVDKINQAVELYLKGVGRFDLSLSDMPGAVRGKINFNRIEFDANGTSYVFVTGTPITRAQYIWVRYDPNPPASTLASQSSYLGSREISSLFPGYVPDAATE